MYIYVGNFYRIRSAFTYGARKLGRILLLPSESIADEINMFFANTLDIHGSGERPDVQEEFPSCPGITSICQNGADSSPSELQTTDANGELCEELNTIKLSGLESEHGSRVESDGLVDDRGLVGYASKVSGSSNGRETSKVPVSISERNNTPTGKACYIPHLFFHAENRYQNGRSSQASSSHLLARSVSLTRPIPSNEEVRNFSQPDPCETESSTRSTSLFSTHASLASSWNTEQLEGSHTEDCLSAGDERIGENGSSKSKNLADLSGEYDVHIRNLLLHVQWNQEYILGSPIPFFTQSSSYPYHNKNPWDSSQQRGAFAHMNTNGVTPAPPFSPSGTYPITSPFISGAYGLEALPKPRGTGTYFPNTVCFFQLLLFVKIFVLPFDLFTLV